MVTSQNFRQVIKVQALDEFPRLNLPLEATNSALVCH